MRDFSKSVASASLAGALFSARQLGQVLARPPRSGESDDATQAFNRLAQAAADQCGESLRETFHAMDRIQREFMDTGFRFVSLDAFNSYGVMESLTGIAKQTTEPLRRWMGSDCECREANQESPCPCSEPANEPDDDSWSSAGAHNS